MSRSLRRQLVRLASLSLGRARAPHEPAPGVARRQDPASASVASAPQPNRPKGRLGWGASPHFTSRILARLPGRSLAAGSSLTASADLKARFLYVIGLSGLPPALSRPPSGRLQRPDVLLGRCRWPRLPTHGRPSAGRLRPTSGPRGPSPAGPSPAVLGGPCTQGPPLPTFLPAVVGREKSRSHDSSRRPEGRLASSGSLRSGPALRAGPCTRLPKGSLSRAEAS